MNVTGVQARINRKWLTSQKELKSVHTKRGGEKYAEKL